MSDSRNITGTVQIDQSSQEAVAFKLMEKIGYAEAAKVDQYDRKYWLTLYRQCHKATKGNLLESILKQE